MKTTVTRRTHLLDTRKYRVERFDVAAEKNYHVDVVVHPGAAVILPLLDDGRIVMVRVERPSVGVELLELPAGTLDPNESPAECARRELREETGYVADSLTPLVRFFSSPGFCTEQLHAFVAAGLHAGAPQREETEQIHNLPLEYDAALAAIESGAIRDGKSIATLLFFDRFRRAARSG